MLPGYLDGLKEAGLSSIIFPFTTEEDELNRLVDLCDGILFTGGHDVSPHLYGEELLNDTVLPEPRRDNMEQIVLRLALAKGKSIFGICRGLQFINVYFGGMLYQDLETQFGRDVNHRQSAPYDVPCHNVMVDKDSPLGKCLEKEVIPVNSCHHQGIKTLANPLMRMAESDDGLVEAFYAPNERFLWAVQWHPEFNYMVDENSRRIFEAFAKSMR